MSVFPRESTFIGKLLETFALSGNKLKRIKRYQDELTEAHIIEIYIYIEK